MKSVLMYLYYTSGLNNKVLSFFVHYIEKNFPFIALKKLFPIHIVRTCLSDNCVFHSEHKIDEGIKTVVKSDNKALLALKEPWLEGQNSCELLLDGNAAILLIAEIKTIDELVWKLVHSVGHLYGLNHCEEKNCAMSNPLFPESDIEQKPLCKQCDDALALASKNVDIKTPN